MKKILTLATAFVAAATLSGGAVAADKVKLELGGFSKWFVIGAWNNNSYQRTMDRSFNNVDVKGQSDITFSGSTKLDNGLDVGVFTAMRAGTNTGIGGGDQNNIIDRAYLYAASGYGKVIMGVLQNGAHLLHVQAPESIGQWGEDGLLTNNEILQRPSGILNQLVGYTTIKNGRLGVLGINGNGINSTSILPGQDGSKVEGITYVAPTFYGLTIAGSYIPNDNKNVRGVINTELAIRDMFAVGANYTNKFGDLGVKVSFGWARAAFGKNWGGPSIGGISVSSQDHQNVNFFNTGLNLSYAGFTLGGSFRWNVHDVRSGGFGAGTFILETSPTLGYSLNGHAWDAGLMYAAGPWAASVSYYGSRIDGMSRTNYGKKEEVTFVQASAMYDLGPGVSLQGLVGYGDYKASTSAGADNPGNGARLGGDQNKGWTAMTGVAVQF